MLKHSKASERMYNDYFVGFFFSLLCNLVINLGAKIGPINTSETVATCMHGSAG